LRGVSNEQPLHVMSMSIVVNACHALAAACRTHKKRVSSLRALFLYVAGLTAVDLALAKPLGNAQAAGLLEAFPSLKAHYGRISLRPSHLLAYSPQAPGVYRVKATEQGGYVFEDAAGDAGERL
jgi:glutathione S-transferase